MSADCAPMRDADAARRAVEALVRGVVADVEDDLAHDGRDVDVRLGGDLAGDVHLTGGDHRLDRDPALRVVLEHRVEDGVADLVGDLVRVALGDRLGGEQTAGHGGSSSCAARLSRAIDGDTDDVTRPAPSARAAVELQHRGTVPSSSQRPSRSQIASASAAFGPSGTSTAAPSAPRIGRGVVVHLEAAAVADLVDHQQVAALARQLARPGASAAGASPVSAAKPTSSWPGAFAAPSSARTSGLRTSAIGVGRRRRPFLILDADDAAPAGSRPTAAAITTASAPRAASSDGVAQLVGRTDAHHLHAGGVGQRDVGRDERDLGAAGDGGLRASA